MKLPRAILADDHKILVEAFRKLLEPHCDVVATVSDGRALLDVAATLKPDVIVLDIGMPLLNGLEAGRQLKKKMPAVKLIFLTMHQDPDLAVEAMRSGASGYLLKTSAPSELLHAIQEVVQLLAEGKSMKQIADVLNVTPRTVAFHKYRTMEELAIKSTAELIQFAIKNHIVVA
jgi:DNA-binding NarL/FixJ family response regulator